MCIHHYFEQQVAATPDGIALIFGQQRITYRALNERANQLAHYLRRRGVRPDSLVGVCMARTPELVVGLLAILKAGGAYLPLDPAYPIERLDWTLRDSQAPLLLTWTGIHALPFPTSSGQSALLPIVREAAVMDQPLGWDQINDESTTNLVHTTSADNLAYVLYTSGSTGRPKGVMAAHRGTLNRFEWMWHAYPFGSDEIACHKTSLSFGDSIWEIFGPLLCGVPAVLVPQQFVADPLRLTELLAEHQVTRIVVVPTLLQMLLDSFPDLHQRLPRLRYWTCSGEALSAALANRFHQFMPNRVLLNLYGSTELAADATYYEVPPRIAATTVPIGFPITGMSSHILDDDFQPVAQGATGNLYIGGVGLARGYLHRPDLTAERFIPNPNSVEPMNRLYQTGDIVRAGTDGLIEYIGRRDQQVKIRGFRVELGEVETQLQHSNVLREAAIGARPDSRGTIQLVAYLVPHEDVPVAMRQQFTQMVRQHLSVVLPDYMIPAAFVLLDELPRLPSGKIDRQSLRTLPISADQHSGSPPRTATERAVEAIWVEVFGFGQIPIDDDFLDIGGHSLLAAQIVARVRDSFQVDISLPSIFAGMTIAGMAAIIESVRSSQVRDQEPGRLEEPGWEEGEI